MTTLPTGRHGRPAAVRVEELFGASGLASALATTPAHDQLSEQIVPEWSHRDRLAPLAKYGINPTRQLLFYGPPGNGKTMTAKWLAREITASAQTARCVRIQCDQLVGHYMGDTARNVTQVLDWVESDPDARNAVVLWDEVDTIFPSRKSLSSSANGREITSAQATYWQRVDNWTNPNLFILATNRRDDLDPALLSRIECQIEFTPPTVDDALTVIDYWAELLHAHGGDVWGKQLRLLVKSDPRDPILSSFRELTQQIHRAARDHVLFFSDDPTP